MGYLLREVADLVLTNSIRQGEATPFSVVDISRAKYFEPDERRILPQLSRGLFAAELRMMHEHGLPVWSCGDGTGPVSTPRCYGAIPNAEAQTRAGARQGWTRCCAVVASR